MKTLLIPIISLFAAAACGARAQDKVTLDKRMQGDWKVVKAERNGESFDAIKNDVLTFSNGNLSIKNNDGVQKGTYQVDEERDPVQVTFFPSDADEVAIQGIVKIENDKLILCLARPGKNRPSEFDPKDPKQKLGIIKATLERSK